MTTQTMKYGMVLPGGTATEQLEHAVMAEKAGWDGVFVWEAAYGVDAWALLGAMAAVTQRVRLGTLLTPLPWRRPWKLASQVATLDQLSGGRAILTVGVGAVDASLPQTGEVSDLRTRADRLDEGIDLLRALWAGQNHYAGSHYTYDAQVGDFAEAARPVQERIPIWVVGVWPRRKSMRRVLRCDGIIPQYHLGGRDGTPDDIRALRSWLDEHGAAPGLDVIAEGETPAGDRSAAAAQVEPWAEAGCTWWLETRWNTPRHGDDQHRVVKERLSAGPPRA